jgi:hypothetical protein
VYILGSVHIPAVCVIKHSGHWNISRYIIVYILGSVHIAVICAVKHSAKEVA